MNLEFSIGESREHQKRFSKLKSKVWIAINWISNDKASLIFKTQRDLVVSIKGKAEYIKWDYIGSNLIAMQKENHNHVLKIETETESIIIIKNSADDSFIFLIEESLFEQGINNLDKIKEYIINNLLTNNNPL
jgi:hypothetical protein